MRSTNIKPRPTILNPASIQEIMKNLKVNVTFLRKNKDTILNNQDLTKEQKETLRLALELIDSQYFYCKDTLATNLEGGRTKIAVDSFFKTVRNTNKEDSDINKIDNQELDINYISVKPRRTMVSTSKESTNKKNKMFSKTFTKKQKKLSLEVMKNYQNQKTNFLDSLIMINQFQIIVHKIISTPPNQIPSFQDIEEIIKLYKKNEMAIMEKNEKAIMEDEKKMTKKEIATIEFEKAEKIVMQMKLINEAIKNNQEKQIKSIDIDKGKTITSTSTTTSATITKTSTTPTSPLIKTMTATTLSPSKLEQQKLTTLESRARGEKPKNLVTSYNIISQSKKLPSNVNQTREQVTRTQLTSSIENPKVRHKFPLGSRTTSYMDLPQPRIISKNSTHNLRTINSDKDNVITTSAITTSVTATKISTNTSTTPPPITTTTTTTTPTPIKTMTTTTIENQKLTNSEPRARGERPKNHLVTSYNIIPQAKNPYENKNQPREQFTLGELTSSLGNPEIRRKSPRGSRTTSYMDLSQPQPKFFNQKNRSDSQPRKTSNSTTNSSSEEKIHQFLNRK